MKYQQLKDIPLDRLKPYENNAKIHTPAQIEHIANSIKQFGFIQPIVVDANSVIVIGHGRYLALQRLGYRSVPVVWKASDLTEQQCAALRLVDNKLNADTGWLTENLQFEMEFLAAEYGELLSDLNLNFSYAELFGSPPKPESTFDPNLIKQLVMHFQDGVYERVVAALHQLMQDTPGLSSNTDVFLYLLDLYGNPEPHTQAA